MRAAIQVAYVIAGSDAEDAVQEAFAPAESTPLAPVVKSSDASDLPPLGLGVLAGLVLTAAATGRGVRAPLRR